MGSVGTAPAGKTLIGTGNTSSPTFSDIGTQSGLTAHGIVLSQGASAFTSLAPGATAGQIVQSAGAASNPVYSTATYPSTATSTGTILRANGTNWVATTATYPTTTTANQILYSSANNVISEITGVSRAVLTTNSTGVPTLIGLTDGQLIIGSTAGSPAAANLTAGSGISITNASNGITIAATGGGSGMNSLVDFWDDFLAGKGSGTTNIGDSNWLASGLGTSLPFSGHPGTITMNSNNYLYLGDVPTIYPGTGEIIVTWYFKFSALTNFYCNIGLADSLSIAGDQTNGVYFKGGSGINSGNWQSVTSNASTRTTTNSSTALTTGWTVGQIIMNAAGTSVAFYIGTLLSNLTQLANSPIATNIPTAALRPLFSYANGTDTVTVDLFTMKYTLTTAR